MAIPKINLKYSERRVLGLNLTTPALIAFIAYIILAIIIILPFEFPVTDQETGKNYIVKYDLSQRLIVLLLLTIPVALSVYTINCMVTGQCVAWSYIVSIISVFWVALFIITAIIYTMRKNKQ
jgi:hypothetical protein